MRLGKRRQRRLETLVQLNQARLITLCEQLKTATGHVVEPLVGLDASQTQGWPAFEGQQVARVTKELGDDLIRGGLGCQGGDPGGWVWGDRRLRLWERTGQQARHRQDARVTGLGAGLLTDQVAYVLADALSQLTLEGRIGLGERPGGVGQVVGLAQLMVTMGEHRGHRWHQARLLVTEYGENGPLEMLQGLQERFER